MRERAPTATTAVPVPVGGGKNDPDAGFPRRAGRLVCHGTRFYTVEKHWGGCKVCTAVRKLRLKVHLAYRRTGVDGSRWIRAGDNNAVGDQYHAGIYIRWGDPWASHTSPMQVSSGGLSRSWADSQGEFTHTYDGDWLDTQRNSSDGGFKIIMKSCCRVKELINNHGAPYRLETFVNVTDFLAPERRQ